MFLEQLSAIDERVRFQVRMKHFLGFPNPAFSAFLLFSADKISLKVPMEVEHSRAFLDCALTGKKITQVNYISQLDKKEDDHER